MKKITLLLLILSIFSCAKKDNNPLIVPPKYSEMPDLKNIPKASEQKSKENLDVEKLKELLL